MADNFAARLRPLYETGKFPHALLFAGDGALGEAADYAVKLYLCENEDKPCGSGDVCRSCDMINRGIHPDAVRVKDEMPDGSYKIKPLRGLIDSGSLRPRGDVRVYVFEAVDEMSEQCQNTLLKFIEEPAEYNRFIFSAENVSRVLPTVLSRTVRIFVARDERAASPENAQVSEIVGAIAFALARKSEYETLVAFSRAKDRQLFADVLKALLEKLRSVMVSDSVSAKSAVASADIVYKYIKRAEVNPNMAIATTSCALEIYAAYTAVRA
ncbi:MAG: hypothetical protein LBI36_00430 [Oscillospiraceae bacterium]|jgi:hypothetical protein|nr:hypothetical protein [Oscillospiraceae bacterium]